MQGTSSLEDSHTYTLVYRIGISDHLDSQVHYLHSHINTLVNEIGVESKVTVWISFDTATSALTPVDS